MYDINGGIKMNSKSRLTSRAIHLRMLYETRNEFFANRSDSVGMAQRDCLNDPSVYVINRKSLMVNKPQVSYNDDCMGMRDSKMQVLAQTTTFWPLLLRTNTINENWQFPYLLFH